MTRSASRVLYFPSPVSACRLRQVAARSAVLLCIVAGTLVSACNRPQASPATPPPPTVSVLELKPQTVSLTSEWVATLDGYVNAQVRPQVTGYLVRTTYREGAFVRKGDVLFEIDERPFQIAVDQTEAGLAEARAQLGRTERDLQRDTPLAQQRAIAQSQLDNDTQANLAAQAAVKSAEAAVGAAQLNLEFTKVRSLIDGVAAIATAQIGDLVSPTTLLTTVSQVDPIRAYFSLSEPEYLDVASRINSSTPMKSLWKTGTPLRLTLANDQAYPHPGTFLAADRQIDSKTGTIRISASFPNPDRLLRPGQYAKVHADTHVVKNALLVPQRAVTELQGTAQVRLVGADGKVELRAVTLGARVGPNWIVQEGVASGDRVVMDSASIPQGTPVNVKPYDDGAEVPAATKAKGREG